MRNTATTDSTLPLDSLFTLEQLSLAPELRAAGWREPVRRTPRRDQTPDRSGEGEVSLHGAITATLRSLESRALNATTQDLRRSMVQLRGAIAVLRDDDLEYAQGLLLKLERLLQDPLVVDIAAGARASSSDLH